MMQGKEAIVEVAKRSWVRDCTILIETEKKKKVQKV
jgi:hypothetical protein